MIPEIRGAVKVGAAQRGKSVAADCADSLCMRNTAEKFWSQVEVGEPGECWPWNGYRKQSGHGSVCWGGNMIYAHRLAMLLHHGHIPEGAFVLHGCDNPPCCNPSHLRFGTQAENMEDRQKRGRYRLPKRSPRTTWAERDRMDFLVYEGMSRAEVARQLGVHLFTVSKWTRNRPEYQRID